MPRKASVWTAGADLAEALAEAVLAGFPLDEAQRSQFQLSHWTILVPTRRAARKLDDLLFQKAGGRGLVLPRIRPIGDVDEDDLTDQFPDLDVPDVVNKSTRLFFLLQLIDQWADDNSQTELARDVRSSPSQCLGLAQSLGELVDQIETEEVAVTIDDKFFELDLAQHRIAILGLLHLAIEKLPQVLLKNNVMGQAARRNKLIRLEAQRIRDGHVNGPILAVGSTGTNPATRDLLAAIAEHPLGAVVLPGLDLSADRATWSAMAPNHPQYSMKMLMEEMGVTLSEVNPLRAISARASLLQQVLRPAETTAQWHKSAALSQIDFAAAMTGVKVIAAPDRHAEARTIAVLMRQTLTTQNKTAALVTPDRDLAQRVTAELRRWNVEIDDSAGQALLHFGRGQLLDLLIRCVEEQFSPASLVALLNHPLCSLGIEPAQAKHLARCFEIIALRQDVPPQKPTQFVSALNTIKPVLDADRHAHAAIKTVLNGGWDELLGFAQRLASALHPLEAAEHTDFVSHLARFEMALDLVSPRDDAHSSIDQVLDDLLLNLKQDGHHHPSCSMARAMASLRWCLKRQQVRPVTRSLQRLFIYGLPEARMMTADLVILGGLNETIWPAAADPGPWVNRSMRKELGLQQPERDIGITAHDFAQNMDHPTVVLSYAQRKGTDPLMVSRWVLRLMAVLQTKAMTLDQFHDAPTLELALEIDRAIEITTRGVPRPKPPVALRPTTISVSDVEKLRRDPYAVYARKILRLNPIKALGRDLEPRLRGTLFHAALASWAKRILLEPGADSLQTLLASGQDAFAPFADEIEVKHFWWPRFERMAKAIVAWDQDNCSDVLARLVEHRGRCKFKVGDAPHVLTAQVDRIDVLNGRQVKLYDYKTGSLPTGPQIKAGFNPQLTLEAAMVMQGGFGADVPDTVVDAIYITISGGTKPLVVKALKSKDFDLIAISKRHFAGLIDLMADYQNLDTPYLPRVATFKENEASDYDHLSRYAEWSLGAT